MPLPELDVEKIVSDWKGALDEGKVKLSKKKDPEIRNLENSLQQTLGTKVDIKAKGQGQEKLTLNISALKPGLYFVQILSADGQTKIYKELVVQ